MANITVTDLTINGTLMPEPLADGVTITRTKLWSGDVGHTSSGKRVGTLVAIKTSLSIKWGVLTPEQAATIEAACSDGSSTVPVRYTAPDGTTKEADFYMESPVFTWGGWADGAAFYSSVTVTGESVD